MKSISIATTSIALLACVLLTLAGCGGGDTGSSSTPAPSSLSYTKPVSAVQGVAIVSQSPTVTGSVTGYTVSPALPTGLSLNAMSGVISGTPTVTAAQATYTITASGAGGNTTFGWVLTVSAAETVSGTAADGAAVVGATVTLKDAAGKSQTATTSSDGNFEVIVNSLTPPFLLSVDSAGKTLYSYASQIGTANLNPYTSVALQSYYKAQATDVATVFDGTLNSASFPNPQQLTLLLNSITTILQPYLSNAGVALPTQFNPFSTSFTANHTGFDRVLDRTALNSSLLAFTVDNGSGSTAGAISSTVGIQATAASGSTLAEVAVNTTTTNSTIHTSSSSQQLVPVGTGAAQQSALADAQAGVLTLWNNLANLVATKGAGITASDISPYVDTSFLDQGANAAAFTQQVLQFLTSIPSGATMTASLYRVNHFNASEETLDVTVEVNVAGAGAAMVNYLDDDDDPNYGVVFKQETGGSWAFYGHQTADRAHVTVTQQLFYDVTAAATNTTIMQAQVSALQGTLSGASVSGPADSLPACTQTALPAPLTLSSVILSHDAGVFDGNQDRYDLACGALASAPPPAGTSYTFDLTLASNGSTVQQVFPLNSVTNDSGALTQVNGASRATFAASATVATVAGTTLNLSFTPPTTYAVLYSDLTGFCQNANEVVSGGGSDLQGTLNDIPANTNSGTIEMPSQCDGAATASLSVGVNYIGVNGERSSVTQNIHP